MDHDASLKHELSAFRSRTERYLREGYDRIAAARFVAAAAGPLEGPALDVGTGKGLLATALARMGLDVVSVDVDAFEQATAAVLAAEVGVRDRIRFVRGDATHLPFPDAHFGCAAMFDVLHHLADPAPVLREMARVVKPRGAIIVADFDETGFELVARVHREDGHEHTRTTATVDGARRELTRLGFRCTNDREDHHHRVAALVKELHPQGDQAVLDATRESQHSRCILCGADRPGGFGLHFSVESDGSVLATFPTDAHFQGYSQALHGGVIAALLDAAMTNCLFSLGVVAMTGELTVRFVAPVELQVPVVLRAALVRSRGAVFFLRSELVQEGRLRARATAKFVVRDRAGAAVADGRTSQGARGEPDEATS
jgi:ubiquinone/menaquinone biosynthesis C-methylase UbiE/acyl-coenzyme A thioesterase PaaI-like protein